MAIKRIMTSNFKSFNSLDIQLGKFNVLIGANASGKSNFIRIFEFMRDIENYGLDNAISLQGGIEYLRNIKIGSSDNFSLEVICDIPHGRFTFARTRRNLPKIIAYEEIYRFAIKFTNRRPYFEIAEDKLIQKCKFVRFERHGQGPAKTEELGSGVITFSRGDGRIKVDLDVPQGIRLDERDIIPPFFMERKLPRRALLAEAPFFFLSQLGDVFSNISIYNFDPRQSQKATPITGKAELEEDGRNLALVLKNVIANKDKERKFSNLIKDLLFFVDKVGIEKFADKSLLFKLRETYFGKQYLPASLISDGTINMTALIIALYFQEKELIVIEEPERNIHPYLISKVIDMMKDASHRKQIIITTHNPEIVKYADLENILLVYRDKEGFSNMSKPCEKEEVKTFLEHEMGIEELYVQNVLELGL